MNGLDNLKILSILMKNGGDSFMKKIKIEKIPKDQRIVLIRTFKYIKRNKYAWEKLLSKYPVYRPHGEREEWEEMFQQPTWLVEDIKGKVYEVTPKQIGVTEFWLEEPAKCSYYKDDELVPVTTNLPRYFDNKWFTQKIAARFDMAMRNTPIRYIPFLGRAVEGIDHLIQPVKPYKLASPVKKIVYSSSHILKEALNSIKELSLRNAFLEVLGLKTSDSLGYLKGNFLLTQEYDTTYIDYILENAEKGIATYVKPAVHSGCGMGVIRVRIENNQIIINSSDEGLMTKLIEIGGKKEKNVIVFKVNKKNVRDTLYKIFSDVYFPYHFETLGGEVYYLFEEELRLPKIGKKVEFRFVVQWVEDHFESTANYAKVGASDFVANISLSGKAANTKTILKEIIKRNWTFMSEKEVDQLVNKEVKNMKDTAAAVFQEILDEARHENELNKGKDTYLCPTTLNVAFGSVDFIPTISQNGGLLLRVIEVNTGTIGIGGLNRVDPRAYRRVVRTWVDNIVKACETAFGPNPPRKKDVC